MTGTAELLDDLRAESADLDELVANLDSAGWSRMTPAAGWTIAHQIAHLAWTDRQAVLAATAPDRFQDVVHEAANDPDGFVTAGAEEGTREDPAALLARWRDGREELAHALLAAGESKIPWFGPPMKPASMATARIMETWAHGQDVVDALGVVRKPTDRLRHVAYLGVRTMGFAFMLHGLPAPEQPVRVELEGPNGQRWSWGPDDAADRVTGPAQDFCLLVTQRRHPDDLRLSVSGETAKRWIPIAQAFAGHPGTGRAKGQFPPLTV